MIKRSSSVAHSDAANGITEFFATRVRTQELCVDDVCVSGAINCKRYAEHTLPT